MYNPDFYPTPAAVAQKMIAALNPKEVMPGQYYLNRTRILEPSAGKGDLADALVNAIMGGRNRLYEDHYRERIHCLESDVELQAALKGKGYPLVGTDFLSWEPDEQYDCIVMNPPFSNGDKHLLHAWDILDHGEIVCLLNAETLNNTFSQTRRLLSTIIEEHGEVVQLGQCFSTDAFRKTDVSVVMVHLKKERKVNSFKFQAGPDVDAKTKFTEADFGNEIATRDLIGNLVADFDRCRHIFLEICEKMAELGHYASRFHISQEGVSKALSRLITENPTLELQEAAYAEFVQDLKKKSWHTVFELTRFNSLVSEGVRKELDSLLKENERMAFSKQNITQLLQTLLANRRNILEQCIIEAFDLMTAYYKENRVHVEGWLTNDAWKVNKRVVLPHVFDCSWRNSPSMHWDEERRLNDIDRALAFLEGKSFDQIPVPTSKVLKDLLHKMRGYFAGITVESTYFELRGFLKGTLHLKFKDEELWQRFNIAAAKGRGWLPYDYSEKKSKTSKK